MLPSSTDIQPFATVFGRGLIGEIGDIAAPPFLVVTMADLWPKLEPHLPAGTAVHMVETMERAGLEQALGMLGPFRSIVGIGGGQAIDCAKYFAWRAGLALHQFPSSLSVDAMYGHRAGVRDNAMVRYVGWAVPETVYIDYDLVLDAPPAINRAGIGDVFCFFTGVWDWQYAEHQGRCERRWPYNADLAARSLAKAEAALAGRQAIRDLTEDGIGLIIDAFQWGGASYHQAGWCPRHIEGIEHYVFYALEAATGCKFLHGQAVCLGIIVGALMHERRAEQLASAIHFIGVDVRPKAMGLDWPVVEQVLRDLPQFVRRQALAYGIAHDRAVDDRFMARLKALVEKGHEDARGES